MRLFLRCSLLLAALTGALTSSPVWASSCGLLVGEHPHPNGQWVVHPGQQTALWFNAASAAKPVTVSVEEPAGRRPFITVDLANTRYLLAQEPGVNAELVAIPADYQSPALSWWGKHIAPVFHNPKATGFLLPSLVLTGAACSKPDIQ